MLSEKQLFDLKDEVDEAKTKVSELTGQQTALMKQLKEDWSCKTIEEAEDKLAKMDKDILILDKKIVKGTEELELLLNPKEEE
jgi:peptidoglycan hydrolase CwlO-like protein